MIENHQPAIAYVQSEIESIDHSASNKQFTYPALGALARTKKWTLNGDKSGICLRDGYAVKTLKADGTPTTADTDLVASAGFNSVFDRTCN